MTKDAKDKESSFVSSLKSALQPVTIRAAVITGIFAVVASLAVPVWKTLQRTIFYNPENPPVRASASSANVQRALEVRSELKITPERKQLLGTKRLINDSTWRDFGYDLRSEDALDSLNNKHAPGLRLADFGVNTDASCFRQLTRNDRQRLWRYQSMGGIFVIFPSWESDYCWWFSQRSADPIVDISVINKTKTEAVLSNIEVLVASTTVVGGDPPLAQSPGLLRPTIRYLIPINREGAWLHPLKPPLVIEAGTADRFQLRLTWACNQESRAAACYSWLQEATLRFWMVFNGKKRLSTPQFQVIF